MHSTRNGIIPSRPECHREAIIFGRRLSGAHFADARHGWAVGSNGTILATDDGGSKWPLQTSGVANNLNGVHFADATHGWAVGDNGTILATDDGGRRWRAQDGGGENDLSSVHFADTTHGWAVGDNGTILATANGGGKWQLQDSGTANGLFSGVYFADATHGWVVGADAMILATANGGATWQTLSTGDRNPFFLSFKKLVSSAVENLHGVYLADASHGWAVGQNGTILRWVLPDLGKIFAADTMDGLRAALKDTGVGEDAVGRPLQDFEQQADIVADLKKRIDSDRQELVYYIPPGTSGSTAELLKNPIFLSNVNRIGITIYAFFAITILVTIYRYVMRLTAHYDACADALELSDGVLDAQFHRLVRSLSPVGVDFGKVPASPVDRSADFVRDTLRYGSRRSGPG
jgi:photosystem II stability/assembly factor-like uncharacterized protein